MHKKMDFNKIESSISIMDQTYDANFGEWIKNEENCRIIGHNLKKYIDKYPSHKSIVVIKWIVKDWTLRSIIHLVKKMVIDDIKLKKSSSKKTQLLSKSQYSKRIEIVKGIIYTWNVVFIAEFIFSVSRIFEKSDEKYIFIESILKDFNVEKTKDILKHMDEKIDNKIKNIIVSKINANETTKRKWNKSMIDAFNLL
ncbi:hypothetical protein EDEG_03502 [Edhazardia aedis USNM 41457]|uniref:Uncharacterized protein n=1 Tax=Edhazardia aedis (strain USNM 41457) TaxID=1003232 RepID=J9DL27_EDHAE|nr:hypothetical protein EDEG_03502 [Edhazardia aedis USNM 41457]|eukprot:EJW02052.1 hypothetical protein EDEG_03502 [Edhazardia aedis USNM 41457]